MLFNISGVKVDLQVDDLLAQKINRVINAETAKQNKRTRSTPTRISSLKADHRTVVIDETVCPHCGRDFVLVRNHGNIEIGHCSRCLQDLLRDNRIVYGMFTGSHGYHRVVPQFTPLEPTITNHEPSQPAARHVSVEERLSQLF